MPRGASSVLELAVEKMTTGASLPSVGAEERRDHRRHRLNGAAATRAC